MGPWQNNLGQTRRRQDKSGWHIYQRNAGRGTFLTSLWFLHISPFWFPSTVSFNGPSCLANITHTAPPSGCLGCFICRTIFLLYGSFDIFFLLQLHCYFTSLQCQTSTSLWSSWFCPFGSSVALAASQDFYSWESTFLFPAVFPSGRTDEGCLVCPYSQVRRLS